MDRDRADAGWAAAVAARGAMAGTVATLAMTGVMLVAQRAGWMTETPPTRITRRSLDSSPVGAPSGPALAVAAAAMHLAIGGGAGVAYGLVERLPVVRRLPRLVRGLAFGTALWTAAYVGVLPASGLMPRPARDQRRRPLAMLAAHWVYGVALAGILGRAEPTVSPPAARAARRSRVG